MLDLLKNVDRNIKALNTKVRIFKRRVGRSAALDCCERTEHLLDDYVALWALVGKPVESASGKRTVEAIENLLKAFDAIGEKHPRMVTRLSAIRSNVTFRRDLILALHERGRKGYGELSKKRRMSIRPTSA